MIGLLAFVGAVVPSSASALSMRGRTHRSDRPEHHRKRRHHHEGRSPYAHRGTGRLQRSSWAKSPSRLAGRETNPGRGSFGPASIRPAA